MTFDRLDEQSRQFAIQLFSTFPEWERLARLIGDTHNGQAVLQLRIPQPGTDRVLAMDTSGDEITIQFGEWHTHVGTFLGISADEAAGMAVEIIREILSEERIVSITYRKGNWSGSSLSHIEAPSVPAPDATTEVFSWLGTHNRVIRNE